MSRNTNDSEWSISSAFTDWVSRELSTYDTLISKSLEPSCLGNHCLGNQLGQTGSSPCNHGVKQLQVLSLLNPDDIPVVYKHG